MEDRENEKSYIYRIYGLMIKTNMKLVEAIELEKSSYDIDVNIVIGKIPSEISHMINNGKISRYKINETWFYIDGVGKYYIYNGNLIVVEPDLNASSESIKAYILGSSLGILMIQRNIIAIHGGSININREAIIITGDSGAGKSTLTTALRKRGYAFISDDVSTLSTRYGEDNNRETIEVKVQPSYPQQKLCRDTMLEFNYCLEDYKMVDEDREKYIIPLKNSFQKNKVKLKAIFQLTIYEGDKLEVEEVIGIEKMKIFMKNIYRGWVFTFYNIPIEYFNKCIDTINKISIYRIKRPKDIFTVDEQINKVLEIMTIN